jgi:hypothetical protein
VKDRVNKKNMTRALPDKPAGADIMVGDIKRAGGARAENRNENET